MMHGPTNIKYVFNVRKEIWKETAFSEICVSSVTINEYFVSHVPLYESSLLLRVHRVGLQTFRQLGFIMVSDLKELNCFRGGTQTAGAKSSIPVTVHTATFLCCWNSSCRYGR